MLAKVYWTVIGDSQRREDVADGLEAASGLLRSVVAKELKLRTAPALRFYYDETSDVQNQIDRLMHQVSAADGNTCSEQSAKEEEASEDSNLSSLSLTSEKL
jgi:ribosome-binding factor A